MTQYRYEIRGTYQENNGRYSEDVKFMYITPPCASTYQAKMLFIGKFREIIEPFNDMEEIIESVVRILE